jgi:exodeoxyribonuclease VII large subunit
MALYFKVEGDLIVFFGDTFNHRPAIKALGGRFNGVDKTWTIADSDEMRQKAAAIAKPHGLSVSSAPAPASETKTVKKVDNPFVHDPSLGLTITQLMQQAEQVVSQAFPTPIWVVGEIQSLTRRGGGTIYFDFADAKAGSHQTATMTIKCNVWNNTISWLEKRHTREKIEQVFADGNRLRALVQVKLYKDRGQLSLTIEDIDPAFTQGALALARLELLKKLRQQGLDRKNKSLSMTPFPFKVALITADGSRAQTDFQHQLLDEGQFPGTVLFIPCTMQGERVPSEVISSIKKAIEADADVIVLSRGGGSAADLRWFDGEEIALAIAHCPIPIIAAIGHHEDTCVAEEICHTREKTPTAAADRILEVFRDTRSQINERAHILAVALDREISRFDRLQTDLRERLLQATDSYFSRHRERLVQWALHLQRSFDQTYGHQQSRFVQIAAHLNHFANRQLQAFAEALFAREQQLTRLDPSPWLDSGWTQLSLDGKPLLSSEDTSIGANVQARLRDGMLRMTVNYIEKRPSGIKKSESSKENKNHV